MKHSKKFLELVSEAEKKVSELSTDEVLKKISGNAPVLIIDVREDSEWAQGHIPQAIHLGKGIIERDIEVKVPDPTQELVLYCGGGFRSVLAAESLQKMGYTKVWSMAGGYRAWKDEKKPMQS